MKSSFSQRSVAGMPVWAIAILVFTALTVVVFFTLLAVVSARAAAGRNNNGTPTGAPAFTYNPGLKITPLAVLAGERVLVTGTGWPAEDTIVIGLDLADSGAQPTVELGSVMAAVTADSSGAFSASFGFPTDARWTSQSAALVVGRSSLQPDLVRWSRIELRQPSATPEPTVPASTATPPAGSACTDRAEFVSDVTIPDRTSVQAGKAFDKTWRIRNSGTCTWTTEYALVFVDGNAMGGPASQALAGSVAPGSTVDLKVTLTAPASNGTYTGNWMLRNNSGRRFGIGAEADNPFWVKIQVGTTTGGPTTSGTWAGEYFNNIDLKGSPVLTRSDSKIEFDWKRGSPGSGVSADNFSARWTRKADFEAGVYRFKVSADDGVRLYVDGILVIDSWKDGSVRELTAEVALTKGAHTIKLEYYEHLADAVVRLSWSKLSSPTFSDWKAEYFANRDLKGTPALVRNDRSIDFKWGRSPAATGLPADDFSVRWTRKMSFEDGIYRLRATSDDGVRVYVDGKLVINEWRDQGAKTFAVDLNLSGQRTIVVEYYEHALDAEIRFTIERQVPATATPTPTATASPTVPPPTETPPTEVPLATIYQFAENLCQAEWANASEDLECPGDPGEAKGFAIRTDQPALENGTNPSSPSILMRPELVSFGVTRGVYPAITVQSGDRFQAVIGCPSNQPGCNVVFSLGYQISGGNTVNLGTWAQALDGTVQTLDITLQALSGQQVSFVLSLFAEQASNQNAAYWVNPRIVR